VRSKAAVRLVGQKVNYVVKHSRGISKGCSKATRERRISRAASRLRLHNKTAVNEGVKQ
jgi:hypothetical protein